jgi:hypothetical protein
MAIFPCSFNHIVVYFPQTSERGFFIGGIAQLVRAMES